MDFSNNMLKKEVEVLKMVIEDDEMIVFREVVMVKDWAVYDVMDDVIVN